MRLDDRLHPLEVAGEQASKRLRVGLFAQLRRTGDVAEEHRDRLSLLAAGRRADESSAAA
jgi:hypothetical protein